MLGQVEASGLVLGADPEPDRAVDGLGDQPCHGERERHGDDSGEDLDPEEVEPSAGQEPVGPGPVDGPGGEQSQQHHADQTADPVDAEDVQ